MAWMMSNPQVHYTFGSLGVRHGDTYNVSDDCLSVLEEILRKLAVEDQTLRTFRRAIGFGQNIRKDLIPLLLYVKDDTKICDASKIIDTTIKILVNLTVPVECLLSIESVSRTDIGRHTIFELNKLLTTSKEAFTDSRSTKAVMDHMKHLVETYTKLNVQQCDSINNCLLLLRNILHIPENKQQISNCPLAHSSMQNEIIWNLFTQSIDKIIIYLMSCPQKMYWGVTMVQLIALMYKDQHVGTLQKLLNIWLEASMSESSEDNESNTSPPDQGSEDSSPIITSDPTSDSSDNGGSNDRNLSAANAESIRNKNTAEVVRGAQNRSKALVGMKRVQSTETETSSSSGVSSMAQSTETAPQKTSSSNPPETSDQPKQTNNAMMLAAPPSSQSEVSDCGYVTQVENQESISTSSNDDDQPQKKPVHQKPHIFQKSRYNNQKNRPTTALEKKELRRKKLVKRSKHNLINMKGLMHHTPTDEDITNILKEFTVDFLLKGYGSLVYDLHTQLLTNSEVPIDTSHFFWLVTYFLKFATQLELDLEHISLVLSYDIISYIIFQGAWLYEELEIGRRVSDVDLKPSLRRLHLVVTAIREFIQAVETYKKLSHLSDEDRAALEKLQQQIVQTHDLQNLFLLLLRQYNPLLQSKQYLQDLIVTNHNYLLFHDKVSKTVNPSTDNMMEHIKQFATVEIMRQYGLLLESFRENGEFVNDCVFTMMHHIGGDLEHVSTLFQPSILKTFSQIWETDYEICDDWSDLIEYVIHKFINTPRANRCSPIASMDERLKTPMVSSNSSENHEWTQEDKNQLLDFYTETKNIENITKKFEVVGNKTKTHHSIINELFQQTIITQEQYDEYTRTKQPDVICERFAAKVLPSPESLINGDIRVLKEYLYREDKGHHILWLQNIVIEACYVKLMLGNREMFRNCSAVMEPSVYYHALLNLPIPIVAWTLEQHNILKHQPFILLLHKLGFYLPTDTGKMFVRIPNFWTADYLFSIAQELGPVDSEKLKFDPSLLNGHKTWDWGNVSGNNNSSGPNTCKFSLTELKQIPSMVRYTPMPNSTEWIQNVLRTKITPVMDSTLHIPSHHELSITIPDIECLPCLTPPKLSIVETAMSPNEQLSTFADMDISPAEEDELENIGRNSSYETASLASDLTRMCVSDEEDKP